jgi:hypothetical protein
MGGVRRSHAVTASPRLSQTVTAGGPFAVVRGGEERRSRARLAAAAAAPKAIIRNQGLTGRGAVIAAAHPGSGSFARTESR